MKTVVAKSAGFCYGVQRAVGICENAAEEFNNCVTLGPIIHNDHVIRHLEELNVRAVSDASEAAPGAAVIIRSHGAGRDEYEKLETLGLNTIDATCPYVQRIHDIVQEEEQLGRLPVIIGNRDHPEVIAISGWCDNCEVFETVEELSEWVSDAENARKPQSYVFQTTSSESIYHSSVEIIKKECTNYSIFDTICDATRKRRQEAAELSKIVDAMVVVGDRKSANSLRLVDICRAHCQRVFFITSANELDGIDIRTADTVGITAGASTPAWIIKEVTQKMSEEVKLDETCVDTGMQEPPAEAEAINDEPLTIGDEGSEVDAEEAEAAEIAEAVAEEPEATNDEGSDAEAEEPDAIGDEGSEVAAEDPEIAEIVDVVAEEPETISDGLLTISDEGSEIDDGEPEVAEVADTVAEEPEAINDEGSDAAAEEPEAISDEGSEVSAEEPVAVEAADTVAAARETVEDAETTTVAPEITEPNDASIDALDDSVSSDTTSSSESFEEMLEKSIKTLHTGQKVTGVVTSITATEVSVDLGAKQSGYIPVNEFTDDTNTNIEDFIKPGDTIEAFVMRVNDVEGMIMLSKKRLDAIKNWDSIEEYRETKAAVTGTVTEENKGGVVVNVKGVRVFIPASQTGLPKSTPMSELVKKTVKLRITEVNQSRRRVVGSIRAVQAEERREKSDRIWEEIENGKEYDGVVKSMTSYGVFVDIGGVDGMIHISELSWTRIKQPSEVMAVGDEVRVYILSFDKETRKISLGYKKREDDPWVRFVEQYSVGDVANVKIVKMMPFGAFAEICPGVDGLIHISQISDHRIGLPSEVLSNGQIVDAKITAIDTDRKKISLSIRALIDPTSQPVTQRDVAQAADTDRTPVVVYDTDAPPEVINDEGSDAVAEEPETVNDEVSDAVAEEPETINDEVSDAVAEESDADNDEDTGEPGVVPDAPDDEESKPTE